MENFVTWEQLRFAWLVFTLIQTTILLSIIMTINEITALSYQQDSYF